MAEKRIHIGVPTLNRYDMLGKLIQSLRAGVLKPTDVWIVDNGGDYLPPGTGDWREWDDPVEASIRFHYWRPTEGNIGCAKAWNWLIASTLDSADMRIVVNDDVSFDELALKNLVDAYRDDAIISPDSIIGSNSFSCFMISNRVVEEIGLFDESISPNYAFFEDNDYFYRLKSAGFNLLPAENCMLSHNVSSTLQAMSLQQQLLHHERFRLAESNYVKKWGGLPHQETFAVPYNEPQKVGQP